MQGVIVSLLVPGMSHMPVPIDQKLSTGKSIKKCLKELMISEGIGISKTIADSDGLGAFLESYLEGIETLGPKGNKRRIC